MNPEVNSQAAKKKNQLLHESMEVKEYGIFDFTRKNKRSRKHLINLQISMVHASTVAIIYSINELLKVSPRFIFFKSPMLGLENKEPIRVFYTCVTGPNAKQLCK